MAGNLSGIASYQKNNQVWQKNKEVNNDTASIDNTKGKAANATGASDYKATEWKPIANNSPLVPTLKDGYGTVIGDVNLSDKALDYYNSLKHKFGDMEFILVSKDMKSQVASNAAAYGNAFKPVVLIDDEKLERMANDESFRKKYEGIIAMSQMKLNEAKNSFASSGANVKNFGISVSSDGKMSYFATLEKANDASKKLMQKRQAEKKAEKIKEKKNIEKKKAKDCIEKRREDNKTDKMDDTKDDTDKEYLEFKADSFEDLIEKVSNYAYNYLTGNVITESERRIGQNIDFKG